MSVNPYAEVGEPDRPSRGTLIAANGLLVASVLALLASAGLLAWNRLLAHYLGYGCASLVSFSCVALYRRSTIVITGRYGIVPATWTRLVSMLVLLAGLVLAILHAWLIARHYA